MINSVLVDTDTDPGWSYQGAFDEIVLAGEHPAGVGDWYEKEEGLFYRPLGLPSDLPDELKPVSE